MKRRLRLMVCVIAASACGGSTEPGFTGLPRGLYAAYRPNSGTVWTASWPAGTARSDCAQIGGSITITGATSFTEIRTYSTPPGVGAFFTAERTFSGTYTSAGSGNTYNLTVDGASDLASAQSSSVSQSRDALVLTRTFPLRGGCQLGGPYTIEYIK